jgi:hypothetical protein
LIKPLRSTVTFVFSTTRCLIKNGSIYIFYHDDANSPHRNLIIDQTYGLLTNLKSEITRRPHSIRRCGLHIEIPRALLENKTSPPIIHHPIWYVFVSDLPFQESEQGFSNRIREKSVISLSDTNDDVILDCDTCSSNDEFDAAFYRSVMVI